MKETNLLMKVKLRNTPLRKTNKMTGETANSELWAVNKSLENKIDTFQRQLLRKIFNIRYGENGENWLSNDQLYEVTKQTPWSKKISERRLRFFGHICRLPQNTPCTLSPK